jgi:hypothetical protein
VAALTHLTGRLKQTLREAERAVRRARDAPADSSVSIVGRRNVVVSTNVGSDDAVHVVSSRQVGPIRQERRTTDVRPRAS